MITQMPKPTPRESIDTSLRAWAHGPKSSIKYYGLYVNDKLIPVGNLAIYRKAGLVKSGLMHRLGFYQRSYDTAEQKQRYADAVAYVDELLSKKVIEIKEI